jgi:hypothetical protein
VEAGQLDEEQRLAAQQALADLVVAQLAQLPQELSMQPSSLVAALAVDVEAAVWSAMASWLMMNGSPVPGGESQPSITVGMSTSGPLRSGPWGRLLPLPRTQRPMLLQRTPLGAQASGLSRQSGGCTQSSST